MNAMTLRALEHRALRKAPEVAGGTGPWRGRSLLDEALHRLVGPSHARNPSRSAIRASIVSAIARSEGPSSDEVASSKSRMGLSL